MRSFKLKVALAAAAWLGIGLVGDARAHYSIGQKPTPAEIAGWNTDINREGKNLPPGSGTVVHGREVYDTKCSSCHGDKGQGVIADKLVGGQGTLASATPIKTVGSYWPYATTLFDYIRRAMPLNAPKSLSNDDVYSVAAYILNMNGIVPNDATLDAKSLPAVKMPNRNGFILVDPRPDVKDRRCMNDCREK